MYHSKKIGVFISHIFGEYQQRLCQGIFDTAREYGYCVEVFTSTDGENPHTTVGEEGILHIPVCGNFAGIIFASGTYLENQLASRISSYVSSLSGCPVVTVSHCADSADNVIMDNNSPFADLVEHFIKVHHSRRICYLGCSNEAETSSRRFIIYKETLAKHNIPCLDENVYTTNFGTKHAADALEYFCVSGTPDAVVCYNDRMALDLMLAAHNAGLSIPEDIAISGCDDLELGHNITPTLTTITFPTYEVGRETVLKLLRHISGMIDAAPSIIHAQPLIGCSCGCHYRTSQAPYYAVRQMNEISKKERRIFEDMHMSAALHGITQLDDGMELLSNYISDIPHCSELYICLYENWDSLPSVADTLSAFSPAETESEDNMVTNYGMAALAFGWQNGQRLSPCSFRREDILPTHILQKSSACYICAPLYFEPSDYGYMVISFDDNKLAYDFHVTSWLSNVSRMLKRITDNRYMLQLVRRLEEVYLKDELTGFYNERGFHAMVQLLATDAAATGAPLLAAYFYLPQLKEIEQNYGHSEGNFALQVLAGALKSASPEDAIIARCDRNKFCVLIAGMEPTDAAPYFAHIERYLNNYNRLQRKPYTLIVKHSYHTQCITHISQLDALFNQAEQISS